MKYVQDRNASVETLRTLIKMMAAHPAAFTPLNYAVWYEHLVGTNAKLSSELSKLLKGGAQLDDEIIDNLYEVYITPDCQQDHLKRLIDKIIGFTKETDKQANIFGNSLQSYGNSLKQELGPEELESLISTMAADTNKMQGSISTLQAELAASHQQIEKLNQELNSARGEAMIDPLTGVLNRRGFDIAAKKMCSAGRQVGTCLLMIDIDHFKKVNDTYGHLFGDKVIQALAETLKLKTSAKDIVSRFGGEEFAVLLPCIGSINAVKVAERLRQTIEAGKIRQANSQDYIDGITISIGISTYHDDMTIVELLDQADKALYISKEQGRNRATFFEPTILSHHEVFFKWVPDYSVGIDLIDLQHQKLINLMNDLFVAVSIHDKDQSLTDKLDELLNYVKAHFKLEEALMGEISYEELEKHVHYHNMLIDELGKLLAKATIDKTSTYFEVLWFLKNWIRSHILTEDMKYNKALPVVGFSIKDWEVQAAKG